MRLRVALTLMAALPSVCSRKHAAEGASVDAAPVATVVQDAGVDAEAARERAAALLADIRWMVSKGVTTNPAKAGEGDLASKCDSVEPMRAAHPDPALDEARALCAFDVPLVTANEAIARLHMSPSQASRRLHCDVASREIARARAVKPNDARVRKAEAQRIEACR